MKRLAYVLLAALLWCALAVAGDKEFKRIREFPAGEQTSNVIGSFFQGIKDVNAVQYTFEAPYDKTWQACKRAARLVEAQGGRTVSGINERNGLVTNGVISQAAMAGMGSSAWLDILQIHPLKISDTKTKVVVARKVIEKESDGDWHTQWSNSNIENWVLTRIEEEIKAAIEEEKQAAAQPVVDFKQVIPGHYMSKDNETDYADVRPDGTFFAQEAGQGISGKWELSADSITFVLPNGLSRRGKVRADRLLDDEGRIWIKKASWDSSSAGRPPVEAPSSAPKTIQLGQSPEQVEAILGKPEKIVDLGQKKIYVYRDMKIVFVDGKVADVQ